MFKLVYYGLNIIGFGFVVVFSLYEVYVKVDRMIGRLID